MPSTTAIPSPPQQLRSQRTLERILAATERQLEREPFDTITVRTVVRRARTSVGSFYARFPDKHALLPALHARYEEVLSSRLERLERRLAAPDQTLASAATLVVRHLVRMYGERPHLMRALADYARRDPTVVGDVASRRRRDQHQFIHDALLALARDAQPATSPRSVATALFVADAACRERLLYPGSAHARAVELTERELVDEVARVLVAFLTSAEPGASSPTRSRR